jgi:uncharacterized protein (TIGR02594 family)
MKYVSILATAIMLSGCAAPTVVENKQVVAQTPSKQAEPKRRVSLSQAEILCNQSLLPGKEKYSYYCQFRKPPVASIQPSPLDPNVTIPDHNKFVATPKPTTRDQIVTASHGEDDSGAAFFRKQSGFEQSWSLFSNNGMQKPVAVAKNWEGKHAVRNRKELKQALNVDPLSVAWCAAFVNTMLKQAGFEGTGSLQARSFLHYGSITKQPEYGDIVVFSRGRNQFAGHVGFYVGEELVEGVRYILVLGGNQRKEVNVAYYPANYVLGFRRIV